MNLTYDFRVPRPDVRLRLGLLLRQSHQHAATRLNEAIGSLGLTGRHFGVLLLLDRDGVSTQRDLIRQTGSDKAGMTRTVEDLESLGIVRRSPSPSDRRIALIEMTAKGRVTFDTARRAAAAAAEDLFAGFEDAELEHLAALLSRIGRNDDSPERTA